MKANHIFLLILTVFLISFVSATSIDTCNLAPVKQGNCIQLQQSNNGTYANLTAVIDPTNTIVLQGNYAMAKSYNVYNYTFCNTSTLGTYTYLTIDNDQGNGGCRFEVTAQGINTTNTQGMVYIALFVLLVVMICGSLYLFITIPLDNDRIEFGEVVSINYKKYIKIAMLAVAYVCFLGLMYFSWSISSGILQFTEMANFFYALFRLTFVLMFLVIPSLFVYAVVKFVEDMKIAKDILRGLTVK